MNKYVKCLAEPATSSLYQFGTASEHTFCVWPLSVICRDHGSGTDMIHLLRGLCTRRPSTKMSVAWLLKVHQGPL